MASILVSADGLSAWLPLADGENKVAITCPGWSTSFLALRTSHDGQNASEAKLVTDRPDNACITENSEIKVTGPGFIGGRMSNYGGSPVTITCYPIRQRVSE